MNVSTTDTYARVKRICSTFKVVHDSPAAFEIWFELVRANNVKGKPAHDARLVAVMKANEIAEILTFDRAGFGRYEGIVVHVPNLTSPPPAPT
jgi:predicted nucleic acid-binding protein